MILHRIVEDQAANAGTLRITDSVEEYDFIESLVEQTKPAMNSKPWHYLIATPFRYPPPIPPQYSARFTPPFSGRNALYAAENAITSAYETSYHWMRQRMHLKGLSRELEPRVLFSMSFHDPLMIDISTVQNVAAIMSKGDHSASHRFVLENSHGSSIRYPSCRDPKGRHCVAVFDLKTLGLQPDNIRKISFQFLEDKKACRVINLSDGEKEILIPWEHVA